MKVRYYYWCWSADPDSCVRREDFWYEQEYGWVKWVFYRKENDDFRNPWVEDTPGSEAGPAWNGIVPGAAVPYFPCF